MKMRESTSNRTERLRWAALLKFFLAPFLLLIGSVSSADDVKEAKKHLQQAVSDLEASEQTDLQLFGDIIDLQLKVGDQKNALAALKIYLAKSPGDGGGPGRPGLYKFTQDLVASREPEEFEAILELFGKVKPELAQKTRTFEVVGVGTSRKVQSGAVDWVDWMKVNMVAKAAAKERFKLADKIFGLLSVAPESANPADRGMLGGNVTVEGAKIWSLYLVKNDQADDALKLAKRFSNLDARADVCVAIFQYSKFSEAIEKEIDKALRGASTNSEVRWLNEKLKIRIEKKDAKTAGEILVRLKELNANTAYVGPKVVKLLFEKGDKELAAKLLDETEQENLAKPIDLRTNMAAERRIAEQYAAKGDIEKVIEICGHWTVDIIRPRHRRRMTSAMQPLYGVAKKLAKDGEVDEALRVADAIKDEFWRADTLVMIASTVARTDKDQGQKIYSKAMAVAKTISDVSDRNHIFAKVAGRRITTQTTFDELLAELKIIDDPQHKASLLASEMELQIRKGLTPEKIEKGIEIVLTGGDTMQLQHIVSGLVQIKEFDLAAETIVKIELEYEFEFILYNFMKGLVKVWDLDKQLEFVESAQKAEQANLLAIIWKAAEERDRSRLGKIGIENLQSVSFSENLHTQLLDYYFESEDYENVAKLMEVPLDRNEYVPEDVYQKSIRQRLAKHCQKRVAEQGADSLGELEKRIKPGWAREGVLAVQVKARANDSDSSNVLQRITAEPNALLRAKMRFELARGLVEKSSSRK